MVIWKYPVVLRDDFTLAMPEGAKVLCVQTQGQDNPQVWALVDEHKPKTIRRFILVGTGTDQLGTSFDGDGYIGTFQLSGGSFVFHLFEV